VTQPGQYPGWIWTDQGWQPDPVVQRQWQEYHDYWADEQRRRAAHPHPEPATYPLMLRTWDYAWWRPVVGILLFLVGGLLIAPVLLMPVLAIAAALQGGEGDLAERILDSASLETVTPASMLYLNLTLASLTLVAFLIVRLVHRLRPRWLSSVQPKIRWKFLFACVGLAVIALISSLLVGVLLPHDPSELSGDPAFPTGQLLATAIVILLTTPLQAIGEEYGFRGYLMQAFGSLTDGIARALDLSPRTARMIAHAVALVLTSTLFALAHGVQNFPLFFDRFAFGLMAGLVVILVGGLEAGIALHVLNNLLAFGVAIALNQLDGTLNVSEVSWWQLPVTITQNGVFLLLVLLVARKMGLRNTTAPPGSEQAPHAVAQAAPGQPA
jgi:membrane protease YdiL (CAAX protease family)